MTVKQLIAMLEDEKQEAVFLITDTDGNTYDPIKLVNEYDCEKGGENFVQIQINLD